MKEMKCQMLCFGQHCVPEASEFKKKGKGERKKNKLFSMPRKSNNWESFLNCCMPLLHISGRLTNRTVLIFSALLGLSVSRINLDSKNLNHMDKWL